MLAPWAQEETATANLNDARLNKRLTRLLSDLGSRPTASIPASCGGYNEMTAAYRFFDNTKVSFEKVLQPHVQRTWQRMAEQERVLLVQDTSEIDLTRPQQQVQGAGPLDTTARRGAFLHPLHAFTPDGTPLGTAWCHCWTRDEPTVAQSAAEKRQQRQATPIEDKESWRWLEGLRQARAVAEALPGVSCVCIADSEADVYELFAEPRGRAAVHWLVRACQDRALAGASSGRLLARALEAPVLFTKEITVRGRKAKTACEKRARRQSRQTRRATVEVRAVSVTLRPPHRPDRSLPPVRVNVVLVREVSPPEGEVAVEWLLVTTLPIDTVEQVRQVVEFYTVRWLIEVFFRVYKSGCRVEERRFEQIERHLACAAVYLIVAWRVLYVCRLGRQVPDIDCEALFEPAEWKSVWVVVHRQPPPQTKPKLALMLALVAQLGGYVNRPNRKDPPGVQTIWLGLQRMYDFATAWSAFGPEAPAKRKPTKLM